MNVVLIMVRDNGDRRSFAVSRDATVIGRREDADFRIPLTDVSRKHCRLIKDGTTLLVEDLGSSNGTLRNGERVDKEAGLEAGDTLQIGPVKFVVQIDGVPAFDDVGDAPRAARSASPAAGAARGPLAPPPPPPSFDSSVYDVAAGSGTSATIDDLAVDDLAERVAE